MIGIWPVLCTPFHGDGSIDPAGLERVARFAIDSGAHGLVYPGFASEVDELSADERRTLLAVVAGVAKDRLPVVAGASSASVDEVAARAGEALDLGIRHVMIQAPKSVGADAAAVSAFYGAVAAEVPDMTIVLQNAPAPRGSDLSPAAVLQVVRDNPAIRFVKEETLPSGAAITAILAGAPAHLAGVFGGGGARYVIDEFLRGAAAAMPAVEFTDIHVALYRALNTGNEAEARDLYERTLPLLVIQAFSRMRFTKHVLTRRGVLTNDVVRAKIPPLDARDIAEIDALLARIADLMRTAPLARSAA